MTKNEKEISKKIIKVVIKSRIEEQREVIETVDNELDKRNINTIQPFDKIMSCYMFISTSYDLIKEGFMKKEHLQTPEQEYMDLYRETLEELKEEQEAIKKALEVKQTHSDKDKEDITIDKRTMKTLKKMAKEENKTIEEVLEDAINNEYEIATLHEATESENKENDA